MQFRRQPRFYRSHALADGPGRPRLEYASAITFTARFRSSPTEAARTLWAYGIPRPKPAPYILLSTKIFLPRKSGPGVWMPKGLDWRKALSDDNSGYIEIQAGLFRNQETYAFMDPRQTIQFSEYWMPVREIGGISRATLAGVLSH